MAVVTVPVSLASDWLNCTNIINVEVTDLREEQHFYSSICSSRKIAIKKIFDRRNGVQKIVSKKNTKRATVVSKTSVDRTRRY